MNEPTILGFMKWLGTGVFAFTLLIGTIAGGFLIFILGIGVLFATEETITTISNNLWVIGPMACTVIVFLILTWKFYKEICRRGKV